MQTPEQLTEEFAMPGQLAFDEPSAGMPRARVTTDACSAELYLQGGHLALWQPAEQPPVLFLSKQSAFAPGKAIRGGVPVIFPWFGSPDTSPVHPPEGSPSHGFARTSPWTLRFAALAGEDLHLSLTMDPSDAQMRAGFGAAQLGLDLVLGRALIIRLTAANTSDVQAYLMEQALHAYFQIGSIHQVFVEGLEGTEYLNKPDHFARKRQTDPRLEFESEVDRVYLNTDSDLTLTDPVLRRRIRLSKSNSRTTVIWNPAAELAARLPDLSPNAWEHFACMETANAAEDALHLAPGEAYTMSMHVEVLPLEAAPAL